MIIKKNIASIEHEAWKIFGWEKSIRAATGGGMNDPTKQYF